MLRIFRLTLLLVMSMAFAWSCAENSTPKYELVAKFDPARDAGRDIEMAIAEAKKSHRNVLLDVGGVWCKWCHRLDEFFQKNDDIDEFMHDNYVVLKINYSEENKNEQVLAKYPKIPGYPHLFVLDSDGNLLHSQDTAELEAGDGHDRSKVLHFLETWAPAKTKV